jgi:hypothetical protein
VVAGNAIGVGRTEVEQIRGRLQHH